jgi:hypothetical protein
MFNNSKYTKIYYSIVNRALTRSINDGYIEKHHIIPRSLGGTNDANNIVKLTPKEHFICHRLLTKMVIDSQHKIKMHNAVWMMQSVSSNQTRYQISSNTFAILKENIANSYKNDPNHRSIESRQKQSDTLKGRTWEERFGIKRANELKKKYSESKKGKPRSQETKQKLREANLGKKPGHPSPLQGRITSDDVKKKISNSLKGRPGRKMSDETRQKIRESKIGKVRSDESKSKQSASAKGKPKSPEHRAKLSEAAKRRWAKLI